MTKKAYEIAVEQQKTSGITEGSSKEATNKITEEQKNKEAIIARFNQIDYSKELSLEDLRVIKNNFPLYFATVPEENLTKITSQLQEEFRKNLPNENLPDDELATIVVRHAQAGAKGQDITLSQNETKKLNEIYNAKGEEYLKSLGYTRNENGEYETDPQQVMRMGQGYFELLVCAVEIYRKNDKENLREDLKNLYIEHSDVCEAWGISEEALYAKVQEEGFSIIAEKVTTEYGEKTGTEEEISDDYIFTELNADQITQDKPEEQLKQPAPTEHGEQAKPEEQDHSKQNIGMQKREEAADIERKRNEIEKFVKKLIGIAKDYCQEAFTQKNAEIESGGQVPPTVNEAYGETQQAPTQTPANEINQDGQAQETPITEQPAHEELESQAKEVTQSQEVKYDSPTLNVEEKKGLGKLFDNIKGLVAKGAKRLRGDKQAQLPDGTQRISEDVKYEEKSGKPLTGKDMVELGFTGKGFRAMANRAINTLGQIITSPFVKSNPPEPNQTLTPNTPANDFDTRYAVDVTQGNGTAYTIPKEVSSEPKQKPKEEDIDERY